jgi:hypothetical protein
VIFRYDELARILGTPKSKISKKLSANSDHQANGLNDLSRGQRPRLLIEDNIRPARANQFILRLCHNRYTF